MVFPENRLGHDISHCTLNFREGPNTDVNHLRGPLCPALSRLRLAPDEFDEAICCTRGGVATKVALVWVEVLSNANVRKLRKFEGVWAKSQVDGAARLLAFTAFHSLSLNA